MLCYDWQPVSGGVVLAKEECAPVGQLYITCLNWAVCVLAGYSASPQEGPYEPAVRAPGDGGAVFTSSEMVVHPIRISRQSQHLNLPPSCL